MKKLISSSVCLIMVLSLIIVPFGLVSSAETDVTEAPDYESYISEDGSFSYEYYWDTLYIKGNNISMPNYYDEENDTVNAPWNHLNESMMNVASFEGVTTVSSHAFYNAGMHDLCFDVDNLITEIDEYAFYGCEILGFAKLSLNLKTIGEYAFADCGKLELVIPRSTNYIADNAFDNTDITISCIPGTYAEEYAISHNIKYNYDDALSCTWLYSNGDEIVEYYHEGETLNVPELYYKEGYEAQWKVNYKNHLKVVPDQFSVMPQKRITIRAVYKQILHNTNFFVGDKLYFTTTNGVEGVTKWPGDPTKEHYRFVDWALKDGRLVNGENITDDEAKNLLKDDLDLYAVFEPIKYTANLLIDGKSADRIEYTVEDDGLNLPDVPKKNGYEGRWESYSLSGGDININAIYDCVASIKISKDVTVSDSRYGNSVLFKADVENRPGESKIIWKVNDAIAGEGDTFEYAVSKSSETVSVMLSDKNGNIYQHKNGENTEDIIKLTAQVDGDNIMIKTDKGYDINAGKYNSQTTLNATINVSKGREVNYNDNVILKATATNLPKDCYLIMYINDEEIKGTNTEVTTTLSHVKADTPYMVRAVDEKGNIQKDANGNDLIAKGGLIKCNTSFFTKLISFFKLLFGKTPIDIIEP